MSAVLALEAGPVAVPIAGWLVLAIDELRLALPQSEALQIELAADLEASDAAAQEIGRFPRRGGRSWPAYSLDSALRMQRPAPAGRSLCVFFGTQKEARGILCDRVWPLAANTDLLAEALPGCMNGPDSPVTGLAKFQDGVVAVTGAAELAAYIESLAGDGHG